VQLKTDIPKRDWLPGGLCCCGNEASVTVHKAKLLGITEESLYKIHYHNIPLSPTVFKRTLSFCFAVAAVRAH